MVSGHFTKLTPLWSYSGPAMRWSPFFLLALLGAWPATAGAQCRLCGGDRPLTGEEAPAEPVRLQLETTLDFDKLVLLGAAGGMARLSPDGSRSASGGLISLSPRAMLGEVLIRGEPGRNLRVRMPERIQLFGIRGGSLTIQRLTSDLSPQPRLDQDGRLRVRFGGELLVSGDAEGDYRGDVVITVDYL
jgi:hypothetical protein